MINKENVWDSVNRYNLNLDSTTSKGFSLDNLNYESKYDEGSKKFIDFSAQILEKKINSAERKLSVIVSQLSSMKEENEVIKEGAIVMREENIKITKQIEKLVEDKSSLITILGIFVAFFTFVSIEIKILQDIDNILGIIGFSLLFISFLFIFVLMVDFVSWRWKGLDSQDNKNFFQKWVSGMKWFFTPFTIIICVLIAGGCFLVWKGNLSVLTQSNIRNSQDSRIPLQIPLIIETGKYIDSGVIMSGLSNVSIVSQGYLSGK